MSDGKITDILELYKICEAATVGDKPASTPLSELIGAMDAFHAEVKPSVVKALIVDLQRYEMLYRQSEKTLDRVHCMWAKRMLDATGERQIVLIPDEEFVKYFEELKQLKAENKELSKDAGRYRWLQRQIENCEWMAGRCTIVDKWGATDEDRVNGSEDLDQTIDAAMAREQQP